MELSARNQLPATITEIQAGDVMTEVSLTLDGGLELTAAITSASARRLALKPGDRVLAVVKATEVMIGKA